MKRKKEIIVMSAISCFVAILVLAAATTAWYTGDASAAKLNGLELSVGRTENLKVAKTAGGGGYFHPVGQRSADYHRS